MINVPKGYAHRPLVRERGSQGDGVRAAGASDQHASAARNERAQRTRDGGFNGF